MRCTQYRGITDMAMDFIATNSQSGRGAVYASAKDEGMFDDGPDLYEYRLSDGRLAREFVQAVPWSSGPVIFLGLRVSDGREFLWDQKEIDNA